MASSFSAEVVALIVGMAVATYATKAGGLWVLNRFSLGESGATALETLPGAVVVSIVGVELTKGGPPEWGASLVVVIVTLKTDNVFLGLLTGVVGVLALRTVL